MVCLFGDGLVSDVLFCGGDRFEEDLRWVPRLGGLLDLVEFEDGVTDGGAALFKIVEAFSRGAFFFSTRVELKTKGAGGGGAGREMIDSNTSLPAILTPKNFLAVSANRSVLTDRILPVLVFQAGFWYTNVAERFRRKEFGIFARRAMVDQAREGLCYQ